MRYCEYIYINVCNCGLKTWGEHSNIRNLTLLLMLHSLLVRSNFEIVRSGILEQANVTQKWYPCYARAANHDYCADNEVNSAYGSFITSQGQKTGKKRVPSFLRSRESDKLAGQQVCARLSYRKGMLQWVCYLLSTSLSILPQVCYLPSPWKLPSAVLHSTI